MSHWIYSTEALPNPKLMGQPGYTPDQEYIRWAGITLPVLPEKEWMKLPDSFMTTRKQSWRDAKQEVEVSVSKFKGIIDSRFAERGVIFLDHEPTKHEKEKLEAVSQELNLAWRKKQIEWYENQVREKEVTGHGRTTPTPYENECYEMLNMEKPYSVAALQAQRRPGEVAAERIADAMKDALGEFSVAIQEAMTRPAQQASK